MTETLGGGETVVFWVLGPVALAGALSWFGVERLLLTAVAPRIVAVVGPDDPATAAAIAVLRDLTDPLRTQVATVAVAGTQVTLGLVDERSVRWGDPDRSADKVAVLGPLLGQPGTVYDVSSPDLPTVRP